jgi:hypothetical protein
MEPDRDARFAVAALAAMFFAALALWLSCHPGA